MHGHLWHNVPRPFACPSLSPSSLPFPFLSLSATSPYDYYDSGWRLREDFIDAGTDHGDHVDVALTFSIEITENPHGQLHFDFELFCQDSCYLEVYDNMRLLDAFWNSGGVADTCTSSF